MSYNTIPENSVTPGESEMVEDQTGRPAPTSSPGRFPTRMQASGQDDPIPEIDVVGATYKMSNLPPVFKGSANEDVRAWLTKVEGFCRINNIKDRKKVDLVEYLLEGTAMIYLYDTDISLREQFDQIKELLLERFDDPSLAWIREQTLFERKQGPKESVQSYTDDFTRLCYLLGVSVEDRVNLYINNMTRPVKVWVLGKMPSSFNDAFQEARLKELLTPLESTEESSKPKPEIKSLDTQTSQMRAEIEALKRRLQEVTSNRPVNNNFQNRSPQGGKNLRATTGAPICGYCNKLNHTYANCRERLKKNIVCYACGYPGHVRSQCGSGQQNRSPGRFYTPRYGQPRMNRPPQQPMHGYNNYSSAGLQRFPQSPNYHYTGGINELYMSRPTEICLQPVGLGITVAQPAARSAMLPSNVIQAPQPAILARDQDHTAPATQHTVNPGLVSHPGNELSPMV